jgi:hypothetical protein
MATILIEPITTKSIGGFPVTIDGIDPTDHDCLRGSITTPGGGISRGSWDLNGTMRDGHPDCNLNTRDDAVAADAAATARQLGASA